MLEDSADATTSEADISKRNDNAAIQHTPKAGGIFACSFCTLKEHYDYKGSKPPFARQLVYSEECYIMKDPFSLPNRGEVLVLGGDCSTCGHAVCLSCGIFYAKRFCPKCAFGIMRNLPIQLHGKINNLLTKQADY
ncbi:PREDICTED: cysteine-rich DPF motif domain-containing protein 1 [Dinoponera quadriceps]|uniref:Cysteine-rich DPF motif domain-containing protein 1 n=1 Tax=Dinoponera quadriceps TaxID=609295 RepID=A0A6P3XAA2_DINQU|nr:PREDICTED: cysteine-rich DPF motif domain-containing protein 1 [Dinoponera quadriceps]